MADFIPALAPAGQVSWKPPATTGCTTGSARLPARREHQFRAHPAQQFDVRWIDEGERRIAGHADAHTVERRQHASSCCGWNATAAAPPRRLSRAPAQRLESRVSYVDFLRLTRPR
jgi:hypothetical protein